MNFFKRKTCWSNAEMIWLKLCIGATYLFIGSYFSQFFSSYYFAILTVFVITVIQSLFLWLQKMKETKKDNLNDN